MDDFGGMKPLCGGASLIGVFSLEYERFRGNTNVYSMRVSSVFFTGGVLAQAEENLCVRVPWWSALSLGRQ